MKEAKYRQLSLPNFPKPPNRISETLKFVAIWAAGYAGILFGALLLFNGGNLSASHLDKNVEFLLSMTGILGILPSFGLATALENPRRTIRAGREFLNTRFHR